eukprot:1160632-Pelagomonas_calceolata.AAC.11
MLPVSHHSIHMHTSIPKQTHRTTSQMLHRWALTALRSCRCPARPWLGATPLLGTPLSPWPASRPPRRHNSGSWGHRGQGQ